ncbi:DUF4129 domain-containing protein [Thermococcus camini]|uniref:Protein-glutamine gamma-glutamyltransferase-like C-terminal domain-containing protein n=1 Tax=Thermococcus camini TaxID=2016373 RepID=A0A7G2DBE2_9EURY|nr:DUF4129 domain-containing protein [Thermococcus camini]CAD5244328.1 conserved membrane protein of unknown function [Thermococcus camini]
MGMDQRKTAALAMLALVVIFSLIQSSGVHGGTTTFNFEWYFFLSSLFLFGAAGYVVKLAIEGRLSAHGVRNGKSNPLAGIITLLAIVVAVYLIFFKREPERLVGGKEIGRGLEGVWYNVTSGDFVTVWNQFPGWAYLIPFLLFVAIVLTARRTKKRRPVPEVKFEPELTYDAIEGTPAEKVIRMYKNVVAGLVEKGYPYRKSWTHREHEERLREVFPDLKDLDVLTRLFEKAKYAGRLSEEDATAARESYDRLMEFLR